MMDDRSNWRPTWTSTTIVALVTLLTVAVLIRAVGVTMPATLGIVGALAMAVSVWTAGWQRRRTVGTVVSSLLTLPVGLGLVAATVGTVVVLSGTLFPVSSLARLPATVIDLSARAMVVVGAVAAVFGGAVAVGNVLDREVARRTANGAFETTLLPLLAGLVLVVLELLSFFASSRDVPGLGAVVGDVVRSITTILFEPATTSPQLTTFGVLIAVAAIVLDRVLGALPVREITTDDRAQRALDRAEHVLTWVTTLAAVAVPSGLLIDFLIPVARTRALLSPRVVEFLTTVTTAPLPRRSAWWVIVVGTGVLLVVALLRHLARNSADRIGSRLAPYAASVLLMALTALLAEPGLRAGIEWVGSTLPGAFGTQFDELATSVFEFYGPLAIGLTAVGLILLVATAAMTAVWLTLSSKYLDDRTAGIGIASLALFQTAAFAGVVGVSTPVLFGSLIAAVLVWDVGEFGTTLGKEIGRRARTRRTELVHATGTLAIGGVGAGVGLAVTELGRGTITTGSGTVIFGLLVVIAGLLALVVALR